MIVRNRYKKFDLKSEINIVPLLDVLLVLLLVFMMTSSIVTTNINIDLPSDTNKKSLEFKNHSLLILEVIGIENYNILINDKRIESVYKNQIDLIIKEQIKKDPNTILMIGGNKDIPYDEIIKTLNILHKLGIKSVGLLTKPV